MGQPAPSSGGLKRLIKGEQVSAFEWQMIEWQRRIYSNQDEKRGREREKEK